VTVYEDEVMSFELKLGEATVEVEYIIFCGGVFVQGATVNGEWVDVDFFSQDVRRSWRMQIETKLGIES